MKKNSLSGVDVYSSLLKSLSNAFFDVIGSPPIDYRFPNLPPMYYVWLKLFEGELNFWFPLSLLKGDCVIFGGNDDSAGPWPTTWWKGLFGIMMCYFFGLGIGVW